VHHQPESARLPFPSKSLAGVGVMFYLMLALRAELRQRGAFTEQQSDTPSPFTLHPSPDRRPNLAALLPLVALGTVADVVRLDDNNRILVQQGLMRMRAGRIQPGIAALFQVAGKDARRASAYDLGFVLAPRLNAAGRLSTCRWYRMPDHRQPGARARHRRPARQPQRERRAIESTCRTPRWPPWKK